MRYRHITAILFIALLPSCGTIETLSPDETTPEPSESAEFASRVLVFATDYMSSGQIYEAALSGEGTSLVNTELAYLGSSAVIRSAGGLLYILHDGFSTVSNDNLQIVDPADGFATLGQYSTGNGTNPHDVAVRGARAFISLYNPSADPENTADNGLPADVIEMDTETGEITGRWSFAEYLEDDGDRNACADRMAIVGDVLYVALQDLELNPLTFRATGPGKIGMIDMANGTVIGAITLEGRNPVGLATDDDGTVLAVADMASYDFALGDFDTEAPYGGLELVDLETNASMGLIPDEELGGYVDRVAAAGTDFFVVVSDFDPASFTYASRLIVMPRDAIGPGDAMIFDDSGSDIREIAADGDVVWISRRHTDSMSGVSEPVIEALDRETGERLGEPLIPAVPGMSMVVY